MKLTNQLRTQTRNKLMSQIQFIQLRDQLWNRLGDQLCPELKKVGGIK